MLILNISTKLEVLQSELYISLFRACQLNFVILIVSFSFQLVILLATLLFLCLYLSIRYHLIG